MKTMILALAIATTSTAGYSADFLDPPSAEVPPNDVFDWSGFYVGVSGGGGWGAQDSSVTPDLTSPGDTIDDLSDGFDVDGWLVGVSAGYNADMGAFMLGLEGDVAWSNISGSATTDFLDDMGTPADDTDDVLHTNELATSYNWLSTLRGRLGTTSGPAMVFVTGGLAVASTTDGLTYSNDFGDGPETLDETSVSYGWTAGAGVEYAIAETATVKIEYQYVDLGDVTAATGEYWGNDESDYTVSHSLHIVKAGVNWHF